MAKISLQNQLNYQQEIQDLQAQLSEKKSLAEQLEKEFKKDSHDLEPYYHLALCWEYLEIVSIHCKMNSSSDLYLNKKNNDFLNQSRKMYFTALSELESVVEKELDAPLTQNQETLRKISALNPKRTLNLIHKFRDVYTTVEKTHGDNSKYTWNLFDSQARFLILFKNILDYKQLSVNDPRKPYYAEYIQLLSLLKQMFQTISNRYREKFLLITKETSNMKQAIQFQEALKSICTLLGPPQEVELAKKTIDSWKNILEKEEKRKEEMKRRNEKKK